MLIVWFSFTTILFLNHRSRVEHGRISASNIWFRNLPQNTLFFRVHTTSLGTVPSFRKFFRIGECAYYSETIWTMNSFNKFRLEGTRCWVTTPHLKQKIWGSQINVYTWLSGSRKSCKVVDHVNLHEQSQQRKVALGSTGSILEGVLCHAVVVVVHLVLLLQSSSVIFLLNLSCQSHLWWCLTLARQNPGVFCLPLWAVVVSLSACQGIFCMLSMLHVIRHYQQCFHPACWYNWPEKKIIKMWCSFNNHTKFLLHLLAQEKTVLLNLRKQNAYSVFSYSEVMP